MTTTVLVPIADGTYNAWTQNGGSSKWNNMAVADNAIGMYAAPGSNAYQSFYMSALPAGVAVVNSVTHQYDLEPEGASCKASAFVYVGGGITDGTLRTLSTFAWVAYSEALARPSGSWSPSDFPGGSSGCEAGVRERTGTQNSYVDYVFLSVDWTPAAGGFACLVGGLAGAAIGLAEMAGLAREVYRKTRTLIASDEYEVAWRDIRDHRWPKSFEMRGGLWV